MTATEVKQLIDGEVFSGHAELMETHISWVILAAEYAYKIKKPIQYSFLDFSTLDKRLYYCRQEIRLNWRLTFNVYLDIQEIRNEGNQMLLGATKGKIVDYAIRMKRLDSAYQMNNLLAHKMVTIENIRNLANTIATFHKKASIVSDGNVMDIKTKFNDLGEEIEYLSAQLGLWSGDLIQEALSHSDRFLNQHLPLMEARCKAGYYRDVHGDLHSRNIFLLPQPVIFDCIEFNDDYRQIDILNEIAFLCMDLEAVGREDLSEVFFKYYFKLFPMELTESEKHLFLYYKAYRANVRAKVNSLRARSSSQDSIRKEVLKEVDKYLRLMQAYLVKLN